MSGTPRIARAVAPGGVGNIGPGLDILGLAVAGAGDTVVVRRAVGSGIRIDDPGHPELPADPTRHSAGLAASAVLQRAGAQQVGLVLTVHKGLPLAGGQGGSAASAVAGAAATNALLGAPLDQIALLEACIEAEETVAGRHADNVAPSLLGGIVLIRSLEPLDVVRLPVPGELVVALVRPDQRLRTAEGRAVLPTAVPRSIALHQAAQVGAVIAALAAGDYELLGRAIDDRIAEPARAPLLPGFREAKAAALAAGALGCSISGSGPTAFALARGIAAGERIAAAMVAAYAAAGHAADARVAPVDRAGVRINLEDGAE